MEIFSYIRRGNKEHTNQDKKYTDKDIMMLEFSIEHIFELFVGTIFQRIVCISIGTLPVYWISVQVFWVTNSQSTLRTLYREAAKSDIYASYLQ